MYKLKKQKLNYVTKSRTDVKKLTNIPNIGKAMEKDFTIMGINDPLELIGKNPYQMYDELCKLTSKKHDPCVIDVFISAVRYMEGGPAKKWWEFTDERKKTLEINSTKKTQC